MKIRKVILFIWFFLSCFFTTVIIKANNETGYEEYRKIEFVDNNYTLLINMSKEEQKQLERRVKRKAFGWATFINEKNVKVICTSDVIFSRSNLTRDVIPFTYKTVQGRSNETSKSFTGTLGGKASGKIKAVSASLDASIRGEIGSKQKTSFDETASFSVRIYPRTKVTLIVMVDGLLSQGASKSYFLGITMKKGTWEYIDVICEYYELREEIIN